MRKITKHFILGLALVSVAGVLTGCSKGKDDPNELEIYIANAGYGYQWAHEIKNVFLEQDWVKEKYPDLKITIFQNDDFTYAETVLNAGQASNRYDLLISMNLIGFSGTEDVLDLTELVYEQNIPGTNVKYKDKIFSSYAESFEYYSKGNYNTAPKYYCAPWAGGMNGIVYNASFFKDNDYKVPNTTDELIAICDDFHEKTWKGSLDKTQQFVFIQGKDESYFDNLFDIFWAQYQEVEGYYNYFNGIDDGSLSRNIFKQKGRVKSLEVFSELLDHEESYVSPKTAYQNFMSNQRAFLKGESLLNVNGDWFVSEMKDIREDIVANNPNLDYSFKMMRTPIVSDIIELCESIEDDEELSALITAIDAEETSLSGGGYSVNQFDFDRVKAARGVVSSLGTAHQMVVPSYALAKDAAVDFIRFMATNEAQDAYIEATDGASLPFEYDLQESNPELYNEIDQLHKERIAYLNSSFLKPYTLPSRFNFPLLKYGGVDAFYLSNGYDFFDKIRMDGKTPSDYYDETIAYYTEENWNKALERAGLL